MILSAMYFKNYLYLSLFNEIKEFLSFNTSLYKNPSAVLIFYHLPLPRLLPESLRPNPPPPPRPLKPPPPPPLPKPPPRPNDGLPPPRPPPCPPPPLFAPRPPPPPLFCTEPEGLGKNLCKGNNLAGSMNSYNGVVIINGK